MKKLNIGIVGCGGIAKQKHMPSLAKLSDMCKVRAFCDILPERAEKLKKEYGTTNAKVYKAYQDLVDDKNVDIVYVLTPNVSHMPITVAAFEAGKHVLCEKPMAHTAEDAKKMMDAWKKSGKMFTIGYQNRFRPDVAALHKACAAGELGDIYFAKAHAIRRRGVPTWGVFPDKSQQGGGPLIDIGTHALDITLWMMDNYKPVSVSGSVFHKMGTLPSAVDGNVFGPWDPKTYEVEDSAFGLIKMENGASIYIEASWVLNVSESRESATTLCGTLGGAEIRSGMSYKTPELIYNRARHGQLTDERASLGGSVAYFSGGSSDPGLAEAKSWLNAVKTGDSPMVDPQQAFVVTQILEGIYISAESGKEVVFDTGK